MEKILNVAEYIFREYYRVTGELIDEMKLQKLLYFSQRETLAILNKPLFNEEFEGWKYGPISREIRTVFTEDGMNAETEDIKSDSKYIINNVGKGIKGFAGSISKGIGGIGKALGFG